MPKKLEDKKWYKVRVYKKNFFDKKTETMFMTGEIIKWNRSDKSFSPYEKIVVLGLRK